MALFTIGYEGRTLEECVAILLEQAIDVVVDVRRLPLSHKPGFSKTRLSESLESHGIHYVHMPELGSPKEWREELRHTGDFPQFFRRYRAGLATQEASLASLHRLECEQRICLLCVERSHRHCHRSVLGRTLAERGRGDPVHL